MQIQELPYHFNTILIGAGPTGLGAGYRLKEQGEESFLVLEKNDYPGGLSASFKDKQGFTWDIGGHVLFSHYQYFDKLLDRLLEDEYQSHERISRVRIADTWVPYPFQNNIRYLPPKLQWECVQGLLDLKGNKSVHNFKEWMEAVFGAGIVRLFMRPYNFKVWAHLAETMDFTWIEERVSVVDINRVLKNIILKREDVAWGPNNQFKFPLYGGTGEIFTRMAREINGHIKYNTPVVSIDAHKKIITTKDGEQFSYKYLLNTSPLDIFTGKLSNAPDSIQAAASRLKHNSVHVSGIGINSIKNDSTCWMYFPEDNCPFYRVTNFHNYSPNNVADHESQSAFMAETSFSKHKPEIREDLLDKAVSGLNNTGLISNTDMDKFETKWEYTAEYAYPIPCLERDKALQTIQPWLEKQNIYSRGRFGGWKYEVGNMDHSVMQGVEWVDFILRDNPEKTYKI